MTLENRRNELEEDKAYIRASLPDLLPQLKSYYSRDVTLQVVFEILSETEQRIAALEAEIVRAKTQVIRERHSQSVGGGNYGNAHSYIAAEECSICGPEIAALSTKNDGSGPRTRT